MKQSFNAELKSRGIGIKVTAVFVPFDVQKTFGTTQGKVDVKGTIDGLPLQRTLLSAGDGTHYFLINAAMRKRLGKQDEDTVFVEIEPDDTYKIVEMPDYFICELEENEVAKTEFDLTSPSNKRWMQQYLTDAKSMDTKANRVIKILEMLLRNSRRREGKRRKNG
jgi:Domain of unknown function (DUF1905)/Bacteriocin-protection, YdeI or OmpD-Associated